MAWDVLRVSGLSRDLWFGLDKGYSVGRDMGSGQTLPQILCRLELLECGCAILHGPWLAFTLLCDARNQPSYCRGQVLGAGI